MYDTLKDIIPYSHSSISIDALMTIRRLKTVLDRADIRCVIKGNKQL